MTADDYRLAVRHAERSVPGVKYLLQDPRKGEADLLEYVVDQYSAMVEQCVELKRRAMPCFVSVGCSSADHGPGDEVEVLFPSFAGRSPGSRALRGVVSSQAAELENGDADAVMVWVHWPPSEGGPTLQPVHRDQVRKVTP